MKKWFALFWGAAVLLGTGSCSKNVPVLHIYSWGDYFSEKAVRQFEQKHCCRVRIDVFDSNEAMYAKLKAGAEGYDLIVPSSYMAEMMFQQGMLRELDHNLLSNVDRYLDRSYLKVALDKNLRYCVPYFASYSGIGYHKDRVPDFRPTWRMFERGDLRKRTSLLNDMREVMGAALLTLGYDVNTARQEELDSAVQLVLKWKKQIAKFEVDDAIRALAAGEFVMIHTYSGDILQAAAENPNLQFAIPEEGGTFTFDNLAILRGSPRAELAHAFINEIFEPALCAENMNETMYFTPNAEAVKLVAPQLRDHPAFNIPEAARARCKPLRDLGSANIRYVRAWEKIRQE